MKTISLSILILGLLSSLAIAAEDFTFSFEPSSSTKKNFELTNSFTGGWLKENEKSSGSFLLQSDLKLGPVGVGLDANLLLGDKMIEGFNSVVVRYAEYDDGFRGLRYGVLEKVTLGYGLLMKNYTTRSQSAALLSNQQIGLKGYIGFDRYKAEAMGTWSHVYAVRFSEQVQPWLLLGQSYVDDVDGVTFVNPGGVTVKYNPISGFALDAGVPILPGLVWFTEYAKLNGYGGGISSGLKWGVDFLFLRSYASASYNILDKDFIPAYFNEAYESNPINMTIAAATGQNKNGYIAEAGLHLMSIAGLDLTFENYNTGNAAFLTSFYVQPTEQLFFEGYYKQPDFINFNSLTFEQGLIFGGTLTYKINPNLSLLTIYKKAYDPKQGKVVESQNYGLKFNF